MRKILLFGAVVFLQTQIAAKCGPLTHSSGESLTRTQMLTAGTANSKSEVLHSPEVSVNPFASHSSEKNANEITVDYLGGIDLAPRVLASKTESLTDLPESIQSFIKERSKPNADYISKLPLLEKRFKDFLSGKNELTFSSASTYTLADKSKQYEVMAKFFGITDLPLVFDEKGNLVWVGSFQRLESLVNLDDLSSGSSKISQEDLAYFTNEFKSTAEFKDFVIKDSTSGSDASLNTYANIKCYEFQISKQTDKGSEIWILRYDGSKKLISSYNSGQL